jgi:hypothetical protein
LKKLAPLVDDLRFVQALKHFSVTDKLEFLKVFKMKKIVAGQRIPVYGETID